MLCQIIFLFIQNNQALTLKKSIEIHFREELKTSNFLYLARVVSDLNQNNTIRCPFLSQIEDHQIRPILDLRFQKLCGEKYFERFLLRGARASQELMALNGEKYILEYSTVNSGMFFLALWIMRFSGIFILLLSTLVVVIQKQKSKILLEAEQKLSEARMDLSRQVAHDIRSPLSALSMVIGTLKEVSEDKRILIRNATQRINDIANDLLQKGTNASQIQIEQSDLTAPTQRTHAVSFLPALVDILASEKRMQYREFAGLEIEVDLKNSFASFAKVNETELKRVLSNLVNNSVEAFTNNTGKVNIGVCKTEVDGEGTIEVFVKDNGKGIPRSIIEKIGQKGITDGKGGTQSGSGLGLFHAIKTVESFNGKVLVESQNGQGTVFRIILPLSKPPKWFANKVDFTEKKFLVSLDDDLSIHQIWSGRLNECGESNIEHIRFQSGSAFEEYVTANINKLKQTLFLIDYELLNQSKTGLDIIYDLGLEKYSILVTSRYEEEAIQSRAEKLKLPILPKSLAGFVPFEMPTAKELYDWVLVDDDDLIHLTWRLAAKDSQKTFIAFKSYTEFNAYKHRLDFCQKIYIDSHLGNGDKGEEVAEALYAQGFTNLYLTTGYAADSFADKPFFRAIMGKEPPRS